MLKGRLYEVVKVDEFPPETQGGEEERGILSWVEEQIKDKSDKTIIIPVIEAKQPVVVTKLFEMQEIFMDTIITKMQRDIDTLIINSPKGSIEGYGSTEWTSRPLTRKVTEYIKTCTGMTRDAGTKEVIMQHSRIFKMIVEEIEIGDYTVICDGSPYKAVVVKDLKHISPSPTFKTMEEAQIYAERTNVKLKAELQNKIDTKEDIIKLLFEHYKGMGRAMEWEIEIIGDKIKELCIE